MKRLLLLVVCVSVFALPAAAQPPATGAGSTADPFSKMLKTSFDTAARYLARSAEKMPEANFAFKPTPEVRSFGEILGHVANSHYSYCSRLKGEKNPNEGNNIEQKTAKADIVKALNDSIAYCTAVYADMTDTKALEMMAPPPPAPPAPPAGGAVVGQPPPAPRPAPAPSPRLRLLLGNVTHDQEHYGNLVTYLRLKGIVPPSSEPSR
ncbi:MAG TPA: DinB family protein [Vicinamibacterales bacterium]